MPTPAQIEDWVEFLDDNGCKGVVDFGDWVMCHCPFHEQEDYTRPSFGVNKESGYGNCFGCGKKSWEDICELFGVSSTDFIDGVRSLDWNRFKNKLIGGKKNKFLRFKLPNELQSPYGHKGARDYLNNRGIHKLVVEGMQVRLCMDKASKYCEHLIFPIRDEKGILYFDARYVGENPNKPRWRTPNGSARDRSFYGWRYKVKFKYLCFVEGAGDVIKMKSLGLRHTIAAKYFSERQFNMVLHSGARYLFLAYDEDEAGRYKTSEKTGENISFMNKAKTLFSNAGMYIEEVRFPKGCNDPGDITSESLFYKLNPKLKKFIYNG